MFGIKRPKSGGEKVSHVEKQFGKFSPMNEFSVFHESHYERLPPTLHGANSPAKGEKGWKAWKHMCDDRYILMPWPCSLFYELPKTTLEGGEREKKVFRVILLDLNCFACCWFQCLAPTNMKKGSRAGDPSERELIGCLVIQFLLVSRFIQTRAASRVIFVKRMINWSSSTSHPGQKSPSQAED